MSKVYIRIPCVSWTAIGYWSICFIAWKWAFHCFL